jgi:hypothetical protein
MAPTTGGDRFATCGSLRPLSTRGDGVEDRQGTTLTDIPKMDYRRAALNVRVGVRAA